MAVMRIALPLLFAAMACGAGVPENELASSGKPDGTELFNTYCATCHGRKGNMGINGAKDLTLSTLSRDEGIAVVTNGRRLMMPYKGTLQPKEIEAVVDHALTLRTQR
jgi:cytochrome c6